MSTFDAAMDRDGNRQTLPTPLPFRAVKRVTFDGGTENGIGDIDGTSNPYTLFNVTGDVLVYMFGICKTDLVGNGTIEVGSPFSTAALLAQIADAEDLDSSENWLDATPDIGEGQAPLFHPFTDSAIQLTAGVADITAGVIDFYLFWRPLSDDGNVEAA